VNNAVGGSRADGQERTGKDRCGKGGIATEGGGDLDRRKRRGFEQKAAKEAKGWGFARVRFFALHGAGCNNLDLTAAKELGLAVRTCTGAIRPAKFIGFQPSPGV
jgi:hypothetical protein